MNLTGKKKESRIYLPEEIKKECEAMARYALTAGLEVPGSLMKTLAELTDMVLDLGNDTREDPENRDPMSPDDLQRLTRVHGKLSRIIAPATPRTVLLLSRESRRGDLLRFLGPVTLIRRLMGVAILSLMGFIGLSLSPDVNSSGGGILNSSGWFLLINELFYLTSAALGASFSALFQANQYIVRGTFDPRYESSYWIRFALGLIAGIMLVELIPLNTEMEISGLARPTLAMLGGFSASVVYHILNRLIQSLETLIKGSQNDAIQNQEETLRVRFQERLNRQKLEMATGLLSLREKVGAERDGQEINELINQFLNEMLPEAEISQEETAQPEEPRRRSRPG